MTKLAALALIPAVALSAGCSPTFSNFFGSSDPCQVAENVHSGFVVIAASTKIDDEAVRAERAGIAAIREYCATGNPQEVNLNKLVNAYAAAVSEYKKAKQ